MFSSLIESPAAIGCPPNCTIKNRTLHQFLIHGIALYGSAASLGTGFPASQNKGRFMIFFTKPSRNDPRKALMAVRKIDNQNSVIFQNLWFLSDGWLLLFPFLSVPFCSDSGQSGHLPVLPLLLLSVHSEAAENVQPCPVFRWH